MAVGASPGVPSGEPPDAAWCCFGFGFRLRSSPARGVMISLPEAAARKISGVPGTTEGHPDGRVGHALRDRGPGDADSWSQHSSGAVR